MTNLDTADVDYVGAKDAVGGRTIAVGDMPGAAVFNVGARCSDVEAGVSRAGIGRAGRRREPDIRGTLNLFRGREKNIFRINPTR